MQTISGNLTPANVTTVPDTDDEKEGNFFNILPIAPLLMAGADRSTRRKRNDRTSSTDNPLQSLVDRTFALGVTNETSLAEDDTVVFFTQDGEQTSVAINSAVLNGLLGEPDTTALPEPPEGYHRALIVISDSEAYWSFIGDEGVLDEMMEPLHHSNFSQTELATAIESATCS